ncbi:MAG: ribonuclease HII [Sphingomonadaceae bacterium]|nr:ribonuclease HII [Sphingomonadaceae bacterium]
MIVGVDEAGRGPLAGPVVAAAVILGDVPVTGLADSKKLSPRRRAELETHIRAHCAFAIGEASVAEVDTLNILHATMLAMTRAVAALGIMPSMVLVDGNRLPKWPWTARAIIGGDASEPAISAASILAKEHRDRLMLAADAVHPQYGFAQHKGYGTAAHLAALKIHGPCPLHRQSFAPIRQLSLL